MSTPRIHARVTRNNTPGKLPAICWASSSDRV
jgi:hypothetical protein